MQHLYGGTEVDGIGASGAWRRVALPDGRSGWASGTFLAHQFYQRRPYDAARTSDGSLNQQTAPGTGHAITGRLHADQDLLDNGAQVSWLRVTLAGGTVG